MSVLKSIFGALRLPFHRVDYSVLFVLRKRDQSWGQPYSYNSSGLLNSAEMVSKMLEERGVRSSVVQVADANDIDRVVYQANPDIVIIEAIWCPPTKLRELADLRHHRKRRWLVRIHSELPFLSMEGICVQWALEYPSIPNVHLACNSPVAARDLAELLHLREGHPTDRVLLLPNYYPTKGFKSKGDMRGKTLDVGCFGAIRPLKNNLEQAVAAIFFARDLGRPLRFHINSSRLEGQADPVLKSIRAIFDGQSTYQLVEHPWMDRKEFLELCRQMDIGLQVSFSETFCLVASDLVGQDVPVVGSAEIPWLPEVFQADPSSTHDIVCKMHLALETGASIQLKALKRYSRASTEIWLTALHRLLKRG